MKRNRYEKYRENVKAHSRSPIFLPKEEYAKVISDFNTYLSDEERTHTVIAKPIGDFVYTVINHGFNDYTVIDKQPIEGINDEWDE